ncbi:Longitudinals Lacking-like [Gryllus bimaculatus]|nr:Longitudinals Lacking-like [Gryllus bimaculatus]
MIARACAGAGPDGLHACPVCARRYKHRENLLRHQRLQCGCAPPRFQCAMCPYRARRSDNLLRHVRTVHQRPPVLALLGEPPAEDAPDTKPALADLKLGGL